MKSITSSASKSLLFGKGRRGRTLAVTTSIGAMAAAMLPSVVHAQLNTDDETAVTEVVAIEGQELDGETLGGFLPVVIGGDGDLLFLSRTADDSFITFDGNLDIIADVRPFGLQNIVRPTYSIDSFGDQFALTTRDGIFTGSVSDNIATEIAIGSALDGFSTRDLGNLGSGATPIILNQQTAFLLSNVGVNESDGSFVGNTQNFVLFAGADDTQFELVSGFTDATSLNFAGAEGLFSSSSPLLSSANSAQTSNLFLLNLNDGANGNPIQIGPNGNPQLAGGVFSGGDFTFAGFTFVDNTGGGFLGSGANFDARSFSANSLNQAFVLGNALLGLDGGPGDSLPGELLVFDDQVIAVGSNFRLGVQTSVGEVAFRDFDNVILAENGDLLFTAEATQTNGQPLNNPIGLWRVINPGLANQAIVPVLTSGDGLIISAANLSQLFQGGGATTASVAGFDLFDISRSQGIATDGRPSLISVNEQGHVATIVEIESSSGTVEAIVAQDDNGDFHVVAFIGQVIDVDGQGDLRRITNFTAQFGSNDIDGAGDLFNIDEQLGFIVTLDRDSTSAVEFDQAVFRVSLNGITMAPITEFLWQGGCGDDEFFTRCEINAENGSNWVNEDDITEISPNPPGGDAGQHSATIRESDVRISVESVNLARLDSDSTITLQDGRTLTLTGGGDINRLIIERGTLATAGTLNVDALQVDFGTVTANGRIVVEDNLTISGGRLEGSSGIDVEVGSAIQSTPPQGMLSGNLELETTLRFFDSSAVTIDTATLDIGSVGQLELNDGSNLTIRGSTIVGEGSILVESEGSSITSEGLNFVTASLNFQDANAARTNGAEPDLLRIASRTLSVNQLIFSAPNLSSIAANQGAGVAIDPGATLAIADGGSFVVQSFVEFGQTDGSMGDDFPTISFGNGSTLGIDTFGTALFDLGENGVVNLDRTTVSGGGLFANRSTLNVNNSNFAVVLANFGSATFAGDNIIATSEGAATTRQDDELFRRGVEVATGVDIGGGGNPIAISALLSDVTYTGGNNMIAGDGAAFLIDNRLEGGRLDSTARTLIAGDITLDDQAVFAVFGSESAPTAFAVLATAPEATLEASATLNGNGFALLEFTEIQGLISPNNDQFQFANLTNRLGSEFLTADAGILNSNAPVDPTPGGFLQISNSSIDDVALVNAGAARLENVTFLPHGQVLNAGLLNIAGAIRDNSEIDGFRTATIVNGDDGRLQLTASDLVEVIVDNFGLITVSGETVNVTLEELFTDGANDDGELVFGFHAVNDGASLTVNSTNALFVSDDLLTSGGGILSADWFVEDGTVRLLGSDGGTPLIDTIDANSSAEIIGTGTINNLDANGSGLRTVNGVFVGSGGFQGGDIDIGEQGGLVFDEDSRFDALNIASEAQLNVLGNVIFSDAAVAGLLIAESITGDSLDVTGLDAEVNLTSIQLDTEMLTAEVGQIDVRGGATLAYRGTIDADLINVSGLVTSDDFEASTLVEAVQADNVNIFAGGTLVAEELAVVDTLTIRSSGRFLQVGTGVVSATDVELDGLLMGENIFINRDLRVGETGVLDIANNVDVGGLFEVDGTLNAAFLRANLVTVTPGANLTVSRSIDVSQDIVIDGMLIAQADDNEIDGSEVDEGLVAMLGGDLLVGATGVVGGEADIDVGGVIQTAQGSLFAIDGLVVADDGIDFQGETQIAALIGGANIVIGDQTIITGTDDPSQSTADLIRAAFDAAGGSAILIDFAEVDLVADGDLTVEDSASLAVDSGTLVGGNLFVDEGADLLTDGPLVISADLFSRLADSINNLGGGFVGGNAELGGNSNFGQTIIGGDATISGDSVFLAIGEIDHSPPLDLVRSAVDAFFDSIDGVTDDDTAFEFSLGSFTVGALGNFQISSGATIGTDGDAFVGGSLTNGGDALFDGDLFVGFEPEDPGISFINEDEATIHVRGHLGVQGGLVNFGNVQVDEDVLVDGDVRNNGTFRYGQSFTISDISSFENNGVLIGGNQEAAFSLEQGFRLHTGVAINRGLIGGTGTIEGDFLQEALDDSALLPTLSPGFSPGIINITGDATFNDGVILFEIGGLTPGTEHDQINVGGNLTIGSNAMIVVDLLELADGSGIFLPQTGDEIVIFTAFDISPDDVQQINFSVLDELPLGFTLVPDIVQTGDGEIFRVLRGFNGSTLSGLDGLDSTQLAVAGALDFLSTAESGVPSPELFEIAVDLQFTDERAMQLDGLTALSSTAISAIQSSSMRAGSIGRNFAESRLRHHANRLLRPDPQPVSRTTQSGVALANSTGSSGGVLNNEAAASMIAQRASQGGGTEFLAGNGSVFRVIGSTSHLFGDSASRLGTVGFDYDGWSANVGAEFEGSDGGLLLGAAFALGSIDADLDDNRGNVDTDSLAATIYGQYKAGRLTIAAGYSIADLDIDSERQVFGATASGETSGEVQHLFSRLGFDFVATNKWSVGPEIMLVHSDLDVDGFSETGAGALNLSSGSLDRESTLLNLSGTATRQFDAGDWSGLLTIGAGYQWALSGDEFSVSPAAFTAAPATNFSNPLRPLANDGFDLSSDLSLSSGSGLTIALDYDGYWGQTGQDIHGLNFRVSVAF
ncbi:MAG: autotransporter outer membrane beta-barrel domain-containing protein [Erythrobacter sp.]|uniref:autotransporter outer membrane beta-barrel domain-containing protein n=1 Tax=Erythrobacter sp. TaxID=1042 RepID=UPI003266EF09